MESANSKVIRLNIIVDTRNNRIPYALVGKDFVTFLYTFLSLPVATVTRLLNKSTPTGMVGSLGDLYKSLENLKEDDNLVFEANNLPKDSALYPKVPFSVMAAKVPLLPPSEIESFSQKLYTCPDNGHCNATEDPLAVCPICEEYMNVEMEYVPRRPGDEEMSDTDSEDSSNESSGEEDNNDGGFMVTDDLCLAATTFTNQWNLRERFDIQSLHDLKSQFVDMTLAEGLKLLQASFQGKEVLTTVFLDKAGA